MDSRRDATIGSRPPMSAESTREMRPAEVVVAWSGRTFEGYLDIIWVDNLIRNFP
jgi:hypothetical protein